MTKKDAVRKAFERAAKNLEKQLSSKEFRKTLNEAVKESGGYKKKKK
jgi:hypothetical protein|tara:strand:- start:8288 stop:8428 length:141 start_codon:yes stop_codon:yes gene_type:complete